MEKQTAVPGEGTTMGTDSEARKNTVQRGDERNSRAWGPGDEAGGGAAEGVGGEGKPEEVGRNKITRCLLIHIRNGASP